MRAFVLINTKQGKVVPALDLLRRTQGVLSARAVAGTYDIIALVDGEGIDGVSDLVARRIGSMSHIAGTRTSFHLGW